MSSINNNNKNNKKDQNNKFTNKDLAKNFMDLNLEENEKTNNSEMDHMMFRRLRSTYISTRPNLFVEEREDILKSLSKKLYKINDYSKNKESITFSERQNVIQWCLNVLDPLDLTEPQKTSIFHRFCTAYDYIMDKLFLLNKIIKEQDELKILTITIFLLTYKMEGLSLAKLTIPNLINAFLKEIKIEKNELAQKIYQNEMKIISLLEYNPQIFDDNNIHQLSYILLDLFIKKYIIKLKENEEKKIHGALDFINKSIEFSDKILFKYSPIDKSMLSLYSVVEYCCIKRQNVLDSLKKYNRFLRNNMNLIKLTKDDYDKYCIQFAKILYKNKK